MKTDKQPDISASARDFLTSVVPWDIRADTSRSIGNTRKKRAFHGRSFQTIDATLQFVADLKNTQADIYFCTSAVKSSTAASVRATMRWRCNRCGSTRRRSEQP